MEIGRQASFLLHRPPRVDMYKLPRPTSVHSCSPHVGAVPAPCRPRTDAARLNASEGSDFLFPHFHLLSLHQVGGSKGTSPRGRVGSIWCRIDALSGGSSNNLWWPMLEDLVNNAEQFNVYDGCIGELLAHRIVECLSIWFIYKWIVALLRGFEYGESRYT